MGRHRRRRHRGRLRVYLLITLACGGLAVLAHFLFEAPAKIRSYAEDGIDEAVRSAVREEVRSAAKESQKGP